MEVTVHREWMPVGQDGAQRREIFTISLENVVVGRTESGIMVFQESEKPCTLGLPYAIWCVPEGGRSRFRWARRHASDTEKRIGVSNHGACEDLHGAAKACLLHHLDRARLAEDPP